MNVPVMINENDIPHDVGYLILKHFYKENDIFAGFIDSDRNFECGVLNKRTVLCDGYSFYPVTVDFLNEAKQTDSFHMIKIRPSHSKKTYAELVELAYEVKSLSNCSVNIAVDPSMALHITA